MSDDKRNCTGEAPIGYETRVVSEDDCWRLEVLRGGNVVRSERDGGEPEDQLLVRDWKWVPEALAEAYAFGLEDGRRSEAASPQKPCEACGCAFSDVPRGRYGSGRMVCVDGDGCLRRQERKPRTAEASPPLDRNGRDVKVGDIVQHFDGDEDYRIDSFEPPVPKVRYARVTWLHPEKGEIPQAGAVSLSDVRLRRESARPVPYPSDPEASVHVDTGVARPAASTRVEAYPRTTCGHGELLTVTCIQGACNRIVQQERAAGPKAGQATFTPPPIKDCPHTPKHHAYEACVMAAKPATQMPGAAASCASTCRVTHAPAVPISEVGGTNCRIETVRCALRGPHDIHDDGLGSRWTIENGVAREIVEAGPSSSSAVNEFGEHKRTDDRLRLLSKRLDRLENQIENHLDDEDRHMPGTIEAEPVLVRLCGDCASNSLLDLADTGEVSVAKCANCGTPGTATPSGGTVVYRVEAGQKGGANGR